MKLPESFERDYFDLLVPITTDGAAKSRRNLLVSSFIVCALYFFNKSLTELRVLGFSLEDSEEGKILIVAALLIGFWLLIFTLNWFKDFEINRERSRILSGAAKELEKYRERLELQTADLPHDHPNRRRWAEVEREYERYAGQSSRTRFVRYLTLVSLALDLILPILLAGFSLCFIINDMSSIGLS